MTRRRHLKDLVRSRMERTGESYTAARAQLARRARGRVSGGPLVVVPVTDMDRATRFYTEALSLPLRWASATWTIIGHEDTDSIALEPGGVVGADLGIGLRVGDLGEALERVTAAGGTVLDRRGPSARVKDPDGNVVRLLDLGDRGPWTSATGM